MKIRFDDYKQTYTRSECKLFLDKLIDMMPCMKKDQNLGIIYIKLESEYRKNWVKLQEQLEKILARVQN